MSREEEEAEYGVVLPFITVASKGGPHDDDTYTCGWECGEINALLQYGKPNEHTVTVHTINLGQLDLIAMHQGYAMESRSSDFDEWTFVSFRRVRDLESL
jgi:hypothetical protein